MGSTLFAMHCVVAILNYINHYGVMGGTLQAHPFNSNELTLEEFEENEKLEVFLVAWCLAVIMSGSDVNYFSNSDKVYTADLVDKSMDEFFVPQGIILHMDMAILHSHGGPVSRHLYVPMVFRHSILPLQSYRFFWGPWTHTHSAWILPK